LLLEVKDKAEFNLRKWTLFHGTEEQVDNLIKDFFRFEYTHQDSLAFSPSLADDDDILAEMKEALGKFNVPAERCFMFAEEGDLFGESDDEEPNMGDSFEAANDLQKSVARLAWLMENDEEE